ncbi:MAG: hypothetical protein H6662_10815 [Ardenticatenaceae bacterium]|nr:hypothetical protein [Ardenticatenaceae bacterium]
MRGRPGFRPPMRPYRGGPMWRGRPFFFRRPLSFGFFFIPLLFFGGLILVVLMRLLAG